LIDEGALDCEDVESFAARHGVTGRHLRRLFLRHLGSTPHQVAATRRAHFAKKLLDETVLPVCEVANAAGFGSLRAFNDAIRKTYLRTPSQLRSMARRRAPADPDCYRFRLSYRPPLDWNSLLRFLDERSIPGVELVRGGEYRRTVSVGDKVGVIKVSRLGSQNEIVLEVRFPQPRALMYIVDRIRRIFDLAADPSIIEAHLGTDPVLAEQLKISEGVRVAGAWDGFEIAVLAILGQVRDPREAAHTGGRLASLFGCAVAGGWGPTRTFPTAGQLSTANLERAGLSSKTASSIRQLATRVTTGALPLNSCVDVDKTMLELSSIPGVDNLTREYIVMRSLNDPDAFPIDYAQVAKAKSEQWRPWRAYAAILVWRATEAGSMTSGSGESAQSGIVTAPSLLARSTEEKDQPSFAGAFAVVRHPEKS
jgi:AraC family transcriptional regulator of adaptative response / DNA-3-methyladenine glycosylase II